MDADALYDLKDSVIQYVSILVGEVCQHVVDSSLQFIALALLYVGLCCTCYLGCSHLGRTGQWGLLGPCKRVLVVTAHPDDECMFFGPVIVSLTRRSDCSVFILCLSNGNFIKVSNWRREWPWFRFGKFASKRSTCATPSVDQNNCASAVSGTANQAAAIGLIRKNELWTSCQQLGIKGSNITLCQNSRLPDDPASRWPTDVIANLILNHVEMLDVDTLITFDKDGVSGHLNHISLYYATAYLYMEKKLPTGLKVFSLESTNVFRKYWSLLDLPLSYVLSRHRILLSWSERSIIQSAMKAYSSQLVWFRRLYIIFSRYMLVNTLQLMEQESLELDLLEFE